MKSSDASNSSSNTAIASSGCQELDASLSNPSSGDRPGPYASNQPVISLDRQYTQASSSLTPKILRQRPPVPRIIIPDGESINISTPPSTPREEYISRLSSSPAFHTTVGTDATNSSSIMRGRLWYNSLKQIRNRLFPQGSNAAYPSGAWAFSDDEDDDEFMSRTPGRLFSKERWRHLLLSRAGLKKTSKFATSTILGTIMIIALALTAVGQLKSRARATEPVPETLVGLIMDAQIVLIKDSSELEVAFNNKNIRTKVGASQTKDTQPIPWAPIADTEEKYRENPNAFGIALPNNWPALCNSCIEISRNQFVYKTTVRLLGDLEACLDHSKPNPPMTTNIQVNSFATQLSGSVPSMMPASSSGVAVASREHTRPILSKEPDQQMKVDKESLLSAENSFALDGTNVISPMWLNQAEGSLTAATPSTTVPFTTFKSATSFVSNIELSKESEILNGVEKDHPLSRRRHKFGRRLVKRIKAAATEVLTSTPNEKDTTPIQQPNPTITSAFMTTTTPRPESTPNPVDFWSTQDLPLLMVDPLTFMNLTTFDSTTALQNMDRLLIHFRFVECPN
ncbi:hypothetical protein BGW38_001934 [Lunasporangiospora selenospora]|uniref:Uncharacterized protein n=1 Tax=Lunasporangiospora selenospora TaxID=979761 RepID=A0A9P6KHX9_9FUNG|nr:hypothetical protein BGW38_001934 [Lunasporangiospora selenospora]